uniref:DN6507_c0_g1_i1 n=1 Tax=Ceratitis capitata TaxID=7213 RepID=A0A6B7K4I5_CERCA|nr:DN6507_c0_g1_i1 [Ceratitis capitata]
MQHNYNIYKVSQLH